MTKTEQLLPDYSQAVGPDLLDERGPAKFLNISVRTLQRYRRTNGGPIFTIIGTTRIRYLMQDLIAYVDGRRTSDPVQSSAMKRRYASPSAPQSESTGRGGPRLYLAGKISKLDWREHDLGIPLRSVDPEEALDPSFELPMRGWRYGGPFFLSCDHGCTHGPATHGLGTHGCGETIWQDLEPATQATIARVSKVSLDRIEHADGVLAYINAGDPYGTLVEIGCARTLGKPLGILFDKNLPSEVRDDMWFAEKLASVVLYGSITAAFESFLSTAFPECRVEPPLGFQRKAK